MEEVKEKSDDPFRDITNNLLVISHMTDLSPRVLFINAKTIMSINPVIEHRIVKYFIFLIFKLVSAFQASSCVCWFLIDDFRYDAYNFIISVTLSNMTSAAPLSLSVVFTLFSKGKEGKRGRSGGHIWKGYNDYKYNEPGNELAFPCFCS